MNDYTGKPCFRGSCDGGHSAAENCRPRAIPHSSKDYMPPRMEYNSGQVPLTYPGEPPTVIKGPDAYQGIEPVPQSFERRISQEDEDAAYEFYNGSGSHCEFKDEDGIRCGLSEVHEGPHIPITKTDLVQQRRDATIIQVSIPNETWNKMAKDFNDQRAQERAALAVLQSEAFMWLMAGSNHVDIQIAALRPLWERYRAAGGKNWAGK